MKAKLALVVLLVAVVALVGAGCKTTGGGRFNDIVHGKVTFGFNAQSTGGDTDGPSPPPWLSGEWETIGAKGQFQMVVHDSKTKIKGTFTGTWVSSQTGDQSYFFGMGSINGGETEPFFIRSQDFGEPGFGEGDQIIIVIGTNDPNPLSWPPDVSIYSGTLEAGNIKVHKK